ncbi:DNA methyltransferase [Nanoarchaeota archaeon]
MKLFNISKQDLELAKEEVLALTKAKEYKIDDNILILKTNKKLDKRLSYTNGIYKFLFECGSKQLESAVKKFNWNKVYKKNFAVRVNVRNWRSQSFEKRIAEIIYDKLKNPKVYLKNPTTFINFFITKKKVYCCLLEHSIKKDWQERKAHLRPELHPSSLNPKLAKAVINLTGIEKGSLIDPFCGSGGILIEAGLMKLKPVGYDLDRIMVNRTKINLKHYKIKGEVKQENALKLKRKLDYVVTDLPYGKNTKKQNLEELYLNFLQLLEKKLTKKAVVMFPDFIDYKKLIKNTKLKIEKEFDYYLHKSLSKKILVLS